MSISPPTTEGAPGPPPARREETVSNLSDFVRRRLRSVREGELGSLPIVVGIVLIVRAVT